MTDTNDAPKPTATRSLQSVVEEAFAKAIEAHGLDKLERLPALRPAVRPHTRVAECEVSVAAFKALSADDRLALTARHIAFDHGRSFTTREDWKGAADWLGVARPRAAMPELPAAFMQVPPITAVIEASHLGDNMMQLLRRGRAIAAANGRERPNADDRAQAIREISEADDL